MAPENSRINLNIFVSFFDKLVKVLEYFLISKIGSVCDGTYHGCWSSDGFEVNERSNKRERERDFVRQMMMMMGLIT